MPMWGLEMLWECRDALDFRHPRGVPASVGSERLTSPGAQRGMHTGKAWQDGPWNMYGVETGATGVDQGTARWEGGWRRSKS